MRFRIVEALAAKMRGSMLGAAASLMLICLMFCLSAESTAQKKSTSGGKAVATALPNTLTPAEKSAGWKLLFDGKTWNGWRGFRREAMPEGGWVIEEGTIKRVSNKGEPSSNAGDIITVGQYDNFEFQIEYRISPGGNSGIKYLIAEEMVKSGHAGLGFELQLIDDDRHPDAKLGKSGNRTAAALYDLISPKNKVLHPAGEWNQVRLIIHGNHVEHWLNGAKVVEFELGSPALKALIAESKYKNIPGFGEVKKGHIILQDHGNEVWFRNIKLRELPAP